MNLLGSQSIWFEPFSELVVRWFARQDEEVRRDAVGAPEATIRAEARAEKLLKYTRLPSLRQLRTAREWEARWEWREAWQMLVAHADRRGWDVLREYGPDSPHDLARTALENSEREAIIIVEEQLRRQVEQARAAGCLLPLTEDDMAPIALAREVYIIESQQMGRPAKPWVDELAETEFIRRLLGLPFHPLVLSLSTPRQD